MPTGETQDVFAGPASCPIPDTCCSTIVSLVLDGLDAYPSEIRWRFDGSTVENARDTPYGVAEEIMISGTN
jgi:hypothetical protein